MLFPKKQERRNWAVNFFSKNWVTKLIKFGFVFQGLEPVVNASGKLGDNMMDISGGISYLEDEDELRSPGLRDIVSAPF